MLNKPNNPTDLKNVLTDAVQSAVQKYRHKMYLSKLNLFLQN